MLTLMKHQEEALDFLRDRKYAGLFFEMGLGKTVTMLSHLNFLSSPGEFAHSPLPTLIISPLSVVTVWEREILQFQFPFTFSALVGTKEERMEALSKSADVYAINYEGLRVSGMKQALLEKKFQCIVLDECFVGETLVKTPDGFKPISQIQEGDTVCNAIGYGQVKSIFRKKSDQLCVVFTEKSEIICTRDHPFLTQEGWKKACELNATHCIKNYDQTLSVVQGRISKLSEEETFLRSILLSEMENEPTGNKSQDIYERSGGKSFKLSPDYLQQRQELCKSCLPAHVPEQSNVDAGHQRKNDKDSTCNWSQTIYSWRQRYWPNQGRAGFAQQIKRLCLESCNRLRESISWIPHQLQGRHRVSKNKISYRSGWIHPSNIVSPSSRSQEGKKACGVRLVSVANIEQESAGRNFFGDQGVEVFNLEVSGHPSYIITKEELVVHNCHRIKERTALQTQIAIELAANIPYRYILTGTPITKSPEDIWSQLHLLKPGYLGNFYAFRNQHVEFKRLTVRSKNGLIEIKKPYRFKNLDRSNDPKIVPLKEKMDFLCMRKTKAECLDLPEKIYKTIHCPLTKEQSKAYFDLKVGLQNEFNNSTLTVRSATTLMQKLRQICQGFIYHKEDETFYFKSNAKIDMLKDLIEDIAQKNIEKAEPEKVILFTNYIAEIPLLSSALEGYPVLIYDGNSAQRQEIVDKFQAATDPVIFLANIEKAKEGITLTGANHVIYFSNSYNYGSRSQSEDRAHRTGQRRNVIYYDLVCPNTIDEKVVWLLKHKKTMADKITGDAMRLAKLELGIEENEYDNT